MREQKYRFTMDLCSHPLTLETQRMHGWNPQKRKCRGRASVEALQARLPQVMPRKYPLQSVQAQACNLHDTFEGSMRAG